MLQPRRASATYAGRHIFGGGCDEDGNWRLGGSSPRTKGGRTRPQHHDIVRELVLADAPKHFDYVGRDGAGRRIHSAWKGPDRAAIQPYAGLLSCGDHAHAPVGL